MPYIATPTVYSAAAHDTKLAPRGFVSRSVNVQDEIEHPEDGHFAAWEPHQSYGADPRRA